MKLNIKMQVAAASTLSPLPPFSQLVSLLSASFRLPSFTAVVMPATAVACRGKCRQGWGHCIVQKGKNKILIEKFTNILWKWMWRSRAVCQLTGCQDKTHTYICPNGSQIILELSYLEAWNTVSSFLFCCKCQDLMTIHFHCNTEWYEACELVWS